jgi:hypothetical protein
MDGVDFIKGSDYRYSQVFPLVQFGGVHTQDCEIE